MQSSLGYRCCDGHAQLQLVRTGGQQRAVFNRRARPPHSKTLAPIMSTPTSIQPWLALIGVVVGFLLGEGSRLGRYFWQIRRNKELVRSELKAVLAQIPQKRDILNQAIPALQKGHVLPMQSVRAVATGYQSVLEDLYPHLSDLERNCLHVIYERLRVADEFMDAFEDNLTRIVREKTFPDPWSVHIGKIEEMLQSYAVVEELAQSYLSGSPKDVFCVTGNES